MPKQYRSFEAARSYVRSLGLRSTPEFEQWSCSGARPGDIPSNPARIYKEAGWVGIADFLGFTPRMKARSATWRPHDEARAYVRALNFRSARDYLEWAATPARPADIPTNPNIAFKGAGWVSFPDFLGYEARGSGARVAWRPHREAREYVRALGFRSQAEFEEWAATPDRPADIPANPHKFYREDGWVGYPDFLGYSPRRWDRVAIRNFLDSLRPILASLTPAELYAIMLRKRLIDRDFPGNANAPLLEELEGLIHAHDSQARLDRLEELLEHQPQGEKKSPAPSLPVPKGPPRVCSIADLKGQNHLKALNLSEEDELVRFIVQNHVALTWQAVLDQDIDPEALRSEPADGIFGQIRARFLEQYDGATLLPLPAGYAYTKDGQHVIPNLMQRLTAYRVLTDRRIGNWSGGGPARPSRPSSPAASSRPA